MHKIKRSHVALTCVLAAIGSVFSINKHETIGAVIIGISAIVAICIMVNHQWQEEKRKRNHG